MRGNASDFRRKAALLAVGIAGAIVVISMLASTSAVRSSTRPGPGPARGSAFASLAAGPGVALGVTTTARSESASLEQFSELAGKRPRIVMLYQSWSEPLFYRSQLAAIVRMGGVPMITWDPVLGSNGVPLSDIARGEEDRYIDRAAAAAKRWRRPLFIRFAHEMNLRDSPFGPGHAGDTPRSFVAAWRHIVGLFRGHGVKNVAWVWSPNVYCDGRCPFTQFYPGGRWVDWAGLDGYNYAYVDHLPWMSFTQIFGPSYAIMARLTPKPMMIAETSSVEGIGDKPRWIDAIGPALLTKFRRIRALIWFQRTKGADWRINSSAASLAAFRQLVDEPPFS